MDASTTTGSGPVTQYLAEDHRRLEVLLERAVAGTGAVELEAYGEFRGRLLRHIAVEEKLVFPALRAARGGTQHPDWIRLRIDHGAITSLLVPPPTRELVAELRSILDPHNVVEERPGGVYDAADQLPAVVAGDLVERMHAYPPVKVAGYRDGPRVLRRAEDALRLSSMQFAPGRGGE